MISATVTTQQERERDLEWFRGFVEESRWRFAKTYVESYPHEYTLQSWGNSDSFTNAIRCIEQWGITEPFLGTQRKYLHVGERKYWHMGNPSSENAAEHPTLINRAWLDVANYREEARALGYDDDNAEKLISRWRFLLERAQRGGRNEKA